MENSNDSTCKPTPERHLKPAPTPPPNSLTPEEKDLLLRKGVPGGPYVLDCWPPRPYLAVVSNETSIADPMQPAIDAYERQGMELAKKAMDARQKASFEVDQGQSASSNTATEDSSHINSSFNRQGIRDAILEHTPSPEAQALVASKSMKSTQAKRPDHSDPMRQAVETLDENVRELVRQAAAKLGKTLTEAPVEKTETSHAMQAAAHSYEESMREMIRSDMAKYVKEPSE